MHISVVFVFFISATLPEFLLKGDEDDEDFEIDPCGLSPQPSMTEDTMPDMEDLLAHIQCKINELLTLVLIRLYIYVFKQISN